MAVEIQLLLGGEKKFFNLVRREGLMANILEKQKQVDKVMTQINFSLFQKCLTPLGGKVILFVTVTGIY